MRAMPDPYTWLKAAVLGLVQGISEFLPISSSAHLIAFREILDFREPPLAFDVALHVATLAAVILYFGKDILVVLRSAQRFRILGIFVLATVPGVVLGLLLAAWRETVNPWWVVGGWIFSAAYLLLSRGRQGESHFLAVGSLRAFAIGCAQALALFPGVSRSGASIVCGLWLGLERDAACRFSFLLAIPIISGAGAKSAYEVYRSDTGSSLNGPLFLAMGIAFIVGLFAIHFLLTLVRRGGLHRFGWYNLTAAALFAAYLVLR